MLKKVITFFVLLLLLSLFYITAYAYTGNIAVDNTIMYYNAPDVTITVDGNPFNTGDMPPFIIDGNTLVPTKSIANGLGATISWDQATETVTVTKDKTIKFKIGSDYAIVDGNKVQIPGPARIINWQTSYVPMRFLFENLGYNIKWIGDKYLIQATKSVDPQPPAVNNINITNFTSSFVNGVYTITVSADGPINYTQGTVDGDNVKKVYFDLNNAINTVKNNKIDINENGLNNTYIGQNQLTPTAITRLVVSMDYNMPFSITQSQDKKTLSISFNIGNYKVTGISSSKIDNGDQILISTNATHFTPSRYNNSIIIDLPNTSLNMPDGKPIGTIVVNGNIITNVRYSQLNVNTVRVIADANIRADYKVQLTSQGVLLLVVKPDPNKKGLVYIDPGHGGYDPGAVGIGGLQEKDVNLAIGLKLEYLLDNGGYKTMMSRESDVFDNYTQAPYDANNAGANVYVSIHADSFDSPSANGTTVLYFPNGDRGDTRDNYTFAKIIHDNLMKEINTTDRGLSQRPNLFVLNQTKMPAVLVETGFVTSPTDSKLLQDDNFQWQVAQGIYNGIVEYLNDVNSGIVKTTI